MLDFISLSLVCVFVSQKKKKTNIKDRSIFPQFLSRIFNCKSDGEKGSPNNWFQKKEDKSKENPFFFKLLNTIRERERERERDTLKKRWCMELGESNS